MKKKHLDMHFLADEEINPYDVSSIAICNKVVVATAVVIEREKNI